MRRPNHQLETHPHADGAAAAPLDASEPSRALVPGQPRRLRARRPGSAVLSPAPRRRLTRLASDLGQGTVEYVGLLLLMATVLAAVVAASSKLGGEDQIGKQVVTQIGESIKVAGKGK